MAKSPFPWFGGKATPRIKNFILANLPAHDKYIEPFGGGASIMLSKAPASVEEYARTWAGVHDSVEQAVRWYVVARQSFGGIFDNSWGTVTNSTSKGMAQTTAAWKSALDSLPEIHARMQRVQIECADWRDCLKRYSGPGWLAYCDPPYVAGTRKAGGYAHELQDSDHRALIESILHYDGAVVLSGYDSELYKPLEAAGWRKLEIEVVCNAAGRTRASGLQGPGAVKARQSRTECLWIKQ